MNHPTRKSYSFTLSPPERASKYSKINIKNPIKHIYNDDKIQITSILKYNKIKDYIIYPELDDKGRLHYHGTIKMNQTDLTKWYKHGLHKLRQIGYVDCSPVKASLEWHFYCVKNWPLTKDILDIVSPITPITLTQALTVGCKKKRSSNTFEAFFEAPPVEL